MNDAPENITNRELATLIETNREKNEMQHQSIMDSLKLFHETTRITLDGILQQTTKTNGSVRDANVEINKLRMWRSGIIASIAVLTFLIPYVYPLIVKTLQ